MLAWQHSRALKLLRISLVHPLDCPNDRIAAAALYIAVREQHEMLWSGTLERLTGCSEAELVVSSAVDALVTLPAAPVSETLSKHIMEHTYEWQTAATSQPPPKKRSKSFKHIVWRLFEC